MNSLHFEWDENKSASNQVKHGVSFEEVKSVFADSLGRLKAENFERKQYEEKGYA